MTWTKLSDDFSDETWTLSDAAYRLLVEMLNYSNRRLLNCTIPKDEFRRFAKRPEALEELLSGEWCRDVGDSIEVVYHATYQRERDVQIAMQKRNEANGKKGGRPRKPKPANPEGNPDGINNPDGNPEGNPKGRAGTGLEATYGSRSKKDEAEIVNAATGEVSGYPEPRFETVRDGNKVRRVSVAS